MDKEGGRVGPEQGLASPKDLCIVPSVNSDFSELDVLLIANTGNHQIWALALLDTTWWKQVVLFNVSILPWKLSSNIPSPHIWAIQVPLESGKCVRVAGSGAEENRNNSYPMRAAFAQPSGLCSALIVGPPSQPDQRIVFIADSESSSIRQMLLKDGQIKALVGGHRDPLVNSRILPETSWRGPLLDNRIFVGFVLNKRIYRRNLRSSSCNFAWRALYKPFKRVFLRA